MFIPHTATDREAMLRAIGVERLDELFQDVPAGHRFPDLALPPALTEMEVMAELQDLALSNETARELICFLGAGAYNHYIPAGVDAILRRGEFFTAYTPTSRRSPRGLCRRSSNTRA
jgi:glycine dehydrogenase subunit 1